MIPTFAPDPRKKATDVSFQPRLGFINASFFVDAFPFSLTEDKEGKGKVIEVQMEKNVHKKFGVDDL
jgi:hypothetical protein